MFQRKFGNKYIIQIYAKITYFQKKISKYIPELILKDKYGNYQKKSNLLWKW